MSEPQERERGRGDAEEVLSAHHALHVDLPAVEVRDRAGETVRLRERPDDLAKPFISRHTPTMCRVLIGRTAADVPGSRPGKSCTATSAHARRCRIRRRP